VSAAQRERQCAAQCSMTVNVSMCVHDRVLSASKYVCAVERAHAFTFQSGAAFGIVPVCSFNQPPRACCFLFVSPFPCAPPICRPLCKLQRRTTADGPHPYPLSAFHKLVVKVANSLQRVSRGFIPLYSLRTDSLIYTLDLREYPAANCARGEGQESNPGLLPTASRQTGTPVCFGICWAGTPGA
jgi:hypothetical protein